MHFEIYFAHTDPECGPMQRLTWTGPVAAPDDPFVRSRIKYLRGTACFHECEKLEYCTHVYMYSINDVNHRCLLVYEDMDDGLWAMRKPPENSMRYHKQCACKCCRVYH